MSDLLLVVVGLAVCRVRLAFGIEVWQSSRMPNRKRRPARLNISTRPDVLSWLQARALAEEASVSQIATRILAVAMETDRARYGDSEQGEANHV